MSKEKPEILELVKKVKEENDNESFCRLVELYKNVFYKESHKICFVEDFEQIKDILLVEACQEYNPELSLFVTFLTNKIRYYLLRKINSQNNKPKLEYREAIYDCDFLNADMIQENSLDHKRYDNDVVISFLKDKIEDFDERTQKIFELRYYNSLGWREVGKEVGLSGQRAMTIHNQAIQQIRDDIPNEYWSCIKS